MGLLLNYDFSTAPGPLQASTVGGDSTGHINVSVSDPSDTIYCNELLIAVPLGEEAAQLALPANVPTASINTDTWSLVSAEVGELPWDDSQTTWAKYTLKAIGTDSSEWKIGSTNLAPSLEAIVNLAPGKFAYAVQETSGTDPSKLEQNTGKFKLQKVMPYLYAHNLITTAPASPTVPKTEFMLGESIQFEWESNGTWYELYAKGQANPIYTGTATSFALSRGLQTDTTFLLAASTTGNPAKDKPSTGYETVVLYDEITVTVANPALSPTSVTASGDVTVGGDLTVDGTLSVKKAAAFSSSVSALSVTAAGPLNGDSLAVAGDGTVSGKFTANGAASLGATTVKGNLSASGAVSAGSFSTGPISASSVNAGSFSGPYMYLNTGNANAMIVNSSSNTYYNTAFSNRVGHAENWITGVVSYVGGGDDYGFGTNGQYVTASGSATITHLETKSGHRVVTSPLVLEEQVHISGSGRLERGRATVQLDYDAVDVIVHDEKEGYRVLVTPTGRCGGIAVVEKGPDGFVVEELGDGEGDAEFDWLLVSRKRKALGTNEPSRLPERLPEAAAPPAATG